MIRNSVFRVRNFEIWAVLSSNEVELLIPRLCDFMLRNVQKCAVPSRKGVDLLMLKNRLFRLRRVQIWELYFHAAKCSDKSMKGLRFVGTQESCFETWKSSHMGCAALLCGRFACVQELRFKTENRSDMGCDELQGCLFAHCLEWHFQAAKLSDKSSSTMQEGVLLMLRNSFYRLGNFVIFNMFRYGL